MIYYLLLWIYKNIKVFAYKITLFNRIINLANKIYNKEKTANTALQNCKIARKLYMNVNPDKQNKLHNLKAFRNRVCSLRSFPVYISEIILHCTIIIRFFFN